MLTVKTNNGIWSNTSITFSDIELNKYHISLFRDLVWKGTDSIYILREEHSVGRSKRRYRGNWMSLSSPNEWIKVGEELTQFGFFRKIKRGKQVQFKVNPKLKHIINFIRYKFDTKSYNYMPHKESMENLPDLIYGGIIVDYHQASSVTS